MITTSETKIGSVLKSLSVIISERGVCATSRKDEKGLIFKN
jgi:hypothetical protein